MPNFEKLNYFLTCLKKNIKHDGFSCPSCGSKSTINISRKYYVTQLRRCGDCSLLFRTPTTTIEENNKFYQKEYTQGYTTDMPSIHELEKLVSSEFKDSERDYSNYIEVLEAIGAQPNSKILDFGCSWGYGSWQLSNKGFSVDSYEISKPRLEYASKHLKVKIVKDLEAVNNKYDFFFSSHVLEHVPSAKSVIEIAKRVLRPGGYFVAFTPNGSEDFKKKNWASWQKLWGLVHPNFLDDVYYKKEFANYRHLVASSPYDKKKFIEWSVGKSLGQESDLTGGEELLVLAKIE